ncbi:MazG nucleotide pyrophosphohydrolase domain-containing protein [Rhizobium sp. L1K21]|uniref:MazG nucleotide pyrophosphohydrolase domain-containing protein n=1 Tax=Rhizobium sp. L1K21 TaxID=2954933 RepID=UPI0020933D5B|nr:MazG nucleotide pyrophosphohydrolase domain-containing protein [Rhizobium sp. L1K21]MCO6185907.1 phosphoribosyl-ATP pyrophosphohydrolase [Rhizobium sp. L1K21]
MAMTIEELTEKVAQVSDIYAKNCGIERDDDWYILKLQEELGELVAEYLRLSARGRSKDLNQSEIRNRLEAEAGDLLAHLLIFARQNDIDLEAALINKWFKYLEE